MAHGFQRIRWLIRRLSRIYPAEIPYRILTVLRVFAQSRGFADAVRVPGRVTDCHYGKPWGVDVWEMAAEQPVLAAARRLLEGDLEVLGQPVPTVDGVPDWNRDPVTGADMPLGFGLLIDPRHLGDTIDIKYLWEVNRHLWWTTLARAYALTDEPAYVERLGILIGSWIDDCPYPSGPNWTSPVEHGIRLINWSIVWHLVGGSDSPIFKGGSGTSLRERWLESIYRHVRFARDNYSFYSSADNHLIGEASGIYVASRTWNLWHDVRRMGAEAKALLEREAIRQFTDDGVNREQAFCYQKFALQFLIAAGLCGRANDDDFSPGYWKRVESGLVFLAAMMDCAGNVPPVGDGDDSDVFRLGHEPGAGGYQALLKLGARLFPGSDVGLKCAALNSIMSPTEDAAPVRRLETIPVSFAQGGYVLLGQRLHEPDEVRVLFDVGPLGYNRIAGHGHADALSVILSIGGRNVLVDPGTYCYNSNATRRRYFRGTAAHNTVVVDGHDQADYGSSFLWLTDVFSTLRAYHDQDDHVTAEAEHRGYLRLRDPVTHCRRVTLRREELTLEVEDWLECRREHRVQLNWHFAADIELQHRTGGLWRYSAQRLSGSLEIVALRGGATMLRGGAEPLRGWVSPSFGVLESAPVLLVNARLRAGQRIRTIFRLTE